MPYPTRYSSRSYKEYEKILQYVFENFGPEKAVEVDMYFESVIDMITINPGMFPFSDKKKNIRRCVVSPQTTLYFRFLGEYVEIISFRGNRMDPKTIGL